MSEIIILGIIVLVTFAACYMPFKTDRKIEKEIKEAAKKIKKGTKWNQFIQNNPFEENYFCIITDLSYNCQNELWVKYDFYFNAIKGKDYKKFKPSRTGISVSIKDFIKLYPYEDKIYNREHNLNKQFND